MFAQFCSILILILVAQICSGHNCCSFVLLNFNIILLYPLFLAYLGSGLLQRLYPEPESAASIVRWTGTEALGAEGARPSVPSRI